MAVEKLVITLRALTIGIGDLIVGVLLGWFPHWRSSSSLRNISHLGLPWWLIGALFIGCAVMVAFPAARAVGYGSSAVLVFGAAWSLMLVSTDAPTANGLAVVGLFMLSGVLLCGVATAQIDRGRSDAP